jgi:hypothetical protein
MFRSKVRLSIAYFAWSTQATLRRSKTNISIPLYYLRYQGYASSFLSDVELQGLALEGRPLFSEVEMQRE